MNTVLKKILPTRTHTVTVEDARGFRAAQRLAYSAVIAVGKQLQPGWTEKQAADLVGTYLRDCGVKAFFHEPFSWFGDRSRFDGIRRRHYADFNPTGRVLKENDVVILDVAPIVNGYIGDIGYTLGIGQVPQLKLALTYLKKLRNLIPKLVKDNPDSFGLVWQKIDQLVRQKKYDNIHQIYPFHVLGHRVRKVPLAQLALATSLRFSLHSFYQVLSGGLFPEILTKDHTGNMTGFWAIEPHIGGKGFGAKFEEILVVEANGDVYWLEEKANWY